MKIFIKELRIITDDTDKGSSRNPKPERVMLWLAIIGLLLEVLNNLGIKIHFGF